MTKRVKPGFRLELKDSTYVLKEACATSVALYDGARFLGYLGREDLAAIQAAEILVDVPTPGQRLLAAVRREGLSVASAAAMAPDEFPLCLERAAQALGITEGGE
jgi:hypothetical protein